MANPTDTEDNAKTDERDGAESKDAESKDAEPKDAEPKDAEPKDAKSKDVETKDAEPKDAEPREPGGEGLLRVGAALGMLVGLVFFLYGAYVLVMGTKALPFAFALIIGGAVNVLTCRYSLEGSRVAWSFALALNGVAAVIFLFGAPKVRDGLDVHILLALLPCLAFGAVTVLFALSADQFE